MIYDTDFRDFPSQPWRSCKNKFMAHSIPHRKIVKISLTWKTHFMLFPHHLKITWTSSYALPYPFSPSSNFSITFFYSSLPLTWEYEHSNFIAMTMSLSLAYERKKNHNFIHGEQNHEEKMQKFVSLIWKVCQWGMYFSWA